MKISKFLWLLAVILTIAAVSLLYTSATNDDVEQEKESVEVQQEVGEDTSVSIENMEESRDLNIEFFNYFEHTAPGEYSEIFVEITGFEPNVQKIIYVRDTDTKKYISAGGQDLITTDLGHISTRFRISSYGNYEVVTYDKNGNEVVSPLLVVN